MRSGSNIQRASGPRVDRTKGSEASGRRRRSVRMDAGARLGLWDVQGDDVLFTLSR